MASIVQFDLQHGFAWVTDEADCLVVLALLQVPFLGSMVPKDWVHGVSHSPVCQILLQIIMKAVITSSPPSWTTIAGMLSAPADCPFSNDCTAASTSFQRMGWSSSVSVLGQFSTDGSPLAL